MSLWEVLGIILFSLFVIIVIIGVALVCTLVVFGTGVKKEEKKLEQVSLYSDEQLKGAKEHAYTILDFIDFSEYLKKFKGQELDDLIDQVEKDHPISEAYAVSPFDYIDREEFAEYLNKRYDMHIEEQVFSCYYIS